MGDLIQRSTRDPGELRDRLAAWLRRVVPGGEVEIGGLTIPAGTGMSSETLLVDARWEGSTHPLAIRVAPDPGDVPLFPTYDLDRQFRVLRLVAERSTVPVPTTRWLEEDPDVLGAPFFVMDRIAGEVPPDVPPYTFFGWILDAEPAQQRALQDASVGILADLHAVPLTADDRAWLEPGEPGPSPLRRHVEHWRAYYDWVRGAERFGVLDDAFAWVEEHWPAEEGEAVLTWGDSRIGNVIYDGFTPVGVLDWEMVDVGPRALDLGWMVFFHIFHQDLAEQFGLRGLPDMFRAEDVAETYARLSGTPVGDLHFWVVWAALRHGIIMSRVHARRVHFGEVQPSDDPEEGVLHRARIRELMAS